MNKLLTYEYSPDQNLPKPKKGISVFKKLGGFFKKDWWKIFRETYLWINIVLMVFPLIFMFLAAAKSNREFSNNILGLPSDFPGALINNFKMAISGMVSGVQYTPFFTMLFNTLIVTGFSLVIMIACALLGGYALAKKNFKGKSVFIIFILIIQIVPFFGYIIPMYYFAQSIGFTDSLSGLVPQLVAVSLPTTIILMQGFYKTFPTAIEEAALIDGCGEVKKFIYIVIPMSKGIIASMVIINFMGYWNEVGITSLMLNDMDLFTISVGVLSTNTITGNVRYDYVMMLLSLSALPNLVFFTIFQKSIMKGVSLGGVKG